MSLITLAIKHGKSVDEARERLRAAVADVATRFGPMIQRVDWQLDGQRVHIFGHGFDVQLSVDDHDVHVVGNIAMLGKLLGNPIVTGIKGILQSTFQKRLTQDTPTDRPT